MASRILGRKWILLSAATLISTLVITAGVFSTRRLRTQQVAQQPRVNYMPPFFSKVKQLEIVRASMWIPEPGNEPIGVEIEIRNNSKKDVVAVDLVCGDGSITHNGLTDEEHPVVVMRPNETTTIRMNFTEMTFGAPLVVSAVTYADGTEEGDEKSLRRMHLAREHDRAVIRSQKERDAQKGVTRP